MSGPMRPSGSSDIMMVGTASRGNSQHLPKAGSENDFPSPASTSKLKSEDEGAMKVEIDPQVVEPPLSPKSQKLADKARRAGTIVSVTLGPSESLDYHTSTNQIMMSEKISQSKGQIWRNFALRWVLAVVVGFLVGICSFCVTTLIALVQNLKFSAANKSLMISSSKAFGTYAGVNVLLALIGTTFLLIFPPARGSGLPEVIGYLNGNRLPRAVGFKVFIVKILALVCHVGSSLPCGSADPLSHLGGIIGGAFAQSYSKTMGCTLPFLQQFSTDRDRRDFISLGAACGLASAFNAPLGGILFSLEEASSFWESILTARAFTAAVVSVFTVNLLQNSLQDKAYAAYTYRFTGVSYQNAYIALDLILCLCIGLLAGIFSSIFVWTIRSGWLTRLNLEKRKWFIFFALFEIAVLSMVVSSVFFGVSTASTCQIPHINVTETDTGYPNLAHWNCQAYNDTEATFGTYSSLFFVSQRDQIRNLFSAPESSNFFPFSALIVFFAFNMVLTPVVNGAWVASGTLMPSLVIGASLGRLFSFIPGFSNRASTFAAVGAASFLAGVTRSMIPSLVIMIELTHDLGGLPVLMLGILVSTAVANIFGNSLQHTLLEARDVAFLPSQPPPNLETLKAGDIMARDVKMLKDRSTLREIVDILQTNNHNGFPVVEWDSQTPVFKGLILRTELFILLTLRFWERRDGIVSSAEMHKTRAQYKLGTGRTVQLEKLLPEELEIAVDLSAYVNTSCFCVYEDFSASVAYRLLRGLGLRHVVVCDRNRNVVGIITRHDFFARFPRVPRTIRPPLVPKSCFEDHPPKQ